MASRKVVVVPAPKVLTPQEAAALKQARVARRAAKAAKRARIARRIATTKQAKLFRVAKRVAVAVGLKSRGKK